MGHSILHGPPIESSYAAAAMHVLAVNCNIRWPGQRRICRFAINLNLPLPASRALAYNFYLHFSLLQLFTAVSNYLGFAHVRSF